MPNILWFVCNRVFEHSLELRMICRACRYDKCLQAGMRRECVQKKRPPKSGKRSKESDDDYAEPKYSAPSQHSIPTSVPHSQHSNNSALHSLSMIKKEVPSPKSPDEDDEMQGEASTSQNLRFDCPASASSSLDSWDETFDCASPNDNQNNTVPRCWLANILLQHFAMNGLTFEGRVRTKNLRDWTGRRLLHHYIVEEQVAMDARRVMYSEAPLVAMVQTTGDIPYTRATLSAHTLSRQRHTIQFEHFLSFQYAQRLPGFHLLNKDEKAHLYKSCALGFSVLDMAWITVKLRTPAERILIFTDGTYSDLTNFIVGWEDEPGLITGEAKKQLFLEFNERIFTELIVPMHEMDLRDFEYAALKALTAWRVWYLQFSNTLQDLAKEHEKLILDGLIDAYKERNESEFATRMGSILLLIGTISDLYRCVAETFTKIQFFNLLDIDHISRTLIKF